MRLVTVNSHSIQSVPKSEIGISVSGCLDNRVCLYCFLKPWKKILCKQKPETILQYIDKDEGTTNLAESSAKKFFFSFTILLQSLVEESIYHRVAGWWLKYLKFLVFQCSITCIFSKRLWAFYLIYQWKGRSECQSQFLKTRKQFSICLCETLFSNYWLLILFRTKRETWWRRLLQRGQWGYKHQPLQCVL